MGTSSDGWSVAFVPRVRSARPWPSWPKVRLVARVAHYYDEERWIAYADRVTSATLARELRKVDVGSLEGGAVERDRSRSHWLEVPCTLEVRARWFEVQRSARRVHGGRVSPATCLEMVVAEVLSALPIDPDLAPAPEVEQGIGAREARALVASASDRHDAVSSPAGSGDPLCLRGPSDDVYRDVQPESRNDDDGGIGETVVSCDLPPAIEALVRDGEDADAAELDRRLRALVSMERRLEAEIGPLLDVLMRLRVYRLLGYANRDSYICERLGMEPSRGRALLRIERAARTSPTFARAYRQGSLSALQASSLVALVLAELDESKLEAWVEWARGTTLRRLRDAVDLALLLRETDWERWQRTGGLPDSEPGAEGAVQGDVPAERGIGAQHSAPEETSSVGCQLDLEVIRVFRAGMLSLRAMAGVAWFPAAHRCGTCKIITSCSAPRAARTISQTGSRCARFTICAGCTGEPFA